MNQDSGTLQLKRVAGLLLRRRQEFAAALIRNFQEGAVEIPIFVLSCRVFGYGIEYALLNFVKRTAGQGIKIIGLYRETPYNEPCRTVYPASNFQWDGQHWVGQDFAAVADPAWLGIETPRGTAFLA